MLPPFMQMLHCYEQDFDNDTTYDETKKRLEMPQASTQIISAITYEQARQTIFINFSKVAEFDKLTTKEASKIVLQELIPHCTKYGVNFSKRMHVEKIQKLFAYFETNLEYSPTFISLRTLAPNINLPDQDLVAALLLQGNQGSFHHGADTWRFQAKLLSSPLQLFA